MRTSVENLQQTQEASSVNVQPTKQAIPVKYTYLHRRQLFEAPFSETARTYLVAISATSFGSKRIDVSWTFDEYHPLMAIGRAVTEFYRQFSGSINTLSCKVKM